MSHDVINTAFLQTAFSFCEQQVTLSALQEHLLSIHCESYALQAFLVLAQTADCHTLRMA